MAKLATTAEPDPVDADQRKIAERARRSGFAPCALPIFNHWFLESRYVEEDDGRSGSFGEGTSSLQRPAGEPSTTILPRLVLRQRENSWQYLASSRAASLWANICSGDKSGRI